ncbi:hypothetical protein [Actinophytocola glycyrrhizae]|uniref:DUF8017 domain-containing protein n=1 Tax=Actinophytocola glycyrrhizae TaxID=2044873 RepID=A0ABV9S284_9PSEU
MTGWQGNDGGQGGWNPQPFGPDPGTNKYGTDPYVNQYGTDPYSDPSSKADPYAQYPPPGYPPTGAFPAQGYPPTGGFPAQGYPPPPPPPKRSKLPMILSLVAIMIIVGAVVAIVLVNRKDTQTAQPQPTSTTESTADPAPTTESSGSSSSADPPPTTGGGRHDDWITVDNTADAGLSYQVPPDWKESSTSRQSGLDVDFTGDADYGLYECGGSAYVRTFAASGDVQGKGGKDLDLSATLTDFAKSFATTYYGNDAEVDVPTPTEAAVEGSTAMTLTAKVTPEVTKPDCQATSGEVALVGVLLESDGQPNGVAMLVVVNDLAGGPAEPAPLGADVTQEILKTVRAG